MLIYKKTGWLNYLPKRLSKTKIFSINDYVSIIEGEILKKLFVMILLINLQKLYGSVV